MLNHIGTQTITTNRLILRRFSVDDIADAFYKWTSSCASRFWEPPHENIQDTVKMMCKYVKKYDNADRYMRAVDFEIELVGLVCRTRKRRYLKASVWILHSGTLLNKGDRQEAAKR